MSFKPITLARISEFQQCIAADHDGHTLSPADYAIVSECFETVFTEEEEPIPPQPTGCKEGYRPGVDWWQGYCLDEPPKFSSSPDGEIGIMGTNADGVRAFSEGRIKRGRIAFEVFFATDIVPQGLGGLHLGCLTSAHKAWGSPVGSPQYKGWLRPDWQFHNGDGENAELRIGTYMADENGSNFTVKSWNTGIILRPQIWIPLSFEWNRQAPDRLFLKVFSMGNDPETTVTIYPGCQDIQGWKFGNMDELDEFGGEPEVRFRNVVVTNLD